MGHVLGTFAVCAFLLGAVIVALSIGAFIDSEDFPWGLFLFGVALFGCGALLGQAGRYQESTRR